MANIILKKETEIMQVIYSKCRSIRKASVVSAA